MSNVYPKMFEPFKLGTMQLKNRIVLPPMGTGLGEPGGYVSQRTLDYYEARAKGGTGLIIVEGSAPSLKCHFGNQLCLGSDAHIEGWKKLVEVVHKHDAKIAVQLMHAGTELRDGQPTQVSPSAVVCLHRNIGINGKPPHELTTEEIQERIRWYADAARRAKEAGLDGVEMHGAHQYIIASFLSSASNIRTDKYGGSPENKARFVIEILQATRKAVGPDFPIWIRLNAAEYGVPNGVTIEETKRIVPLLVEAGAQAIHVSAYGAGSFATKAPISDTPGAILPLAEDVKKVTQVPVIAVGRLDFETGEQALKDGKADLIALGRRLIADPELPKKIVENRFSDIIPCIGCMECIDRAPGAVRTPGMCTINPISGREREYNMQPASKVKTVVVVGGGPAGLETARVAALRGHKVTLFEKESKLGGLLNVAALPPNKSDIIPFTEYLTYQVKKVGVEIRLGTEGNWETIKELNPDVVIIATGGNPVIPDISGLNDKNAIPAADVLSGKASVRQNVVILGGGQAGCETGYYLANQGKKVIIIEILPRMAGDMGMMVRRRLMDGLRTKQVALLTNTKCEEVRSDSVVVSSEGKRNTYPMDSLIVAVGYTPNDNLFKALEGKVLELYRIGDSSQPRGIRESVNEGYRTALSL